METSMAGDSAVREIDQQRSYPQFDCVGSYVWIWEQQLQTESRTQVVARQVHRDRSPR